MKRLTILLFFLSQQLLANQFHFNTEPLTLSDDMFNRYAIPQIRSIHQEYFLMIRQMAPDSGELINLREQLFRLSQDTEKFEKSCPTLTILCTPQISELYRRSRNIDQLVLRHQQNFLKYSEAVLDENIESILWLEQALGQILQLNNDFMNRLESKLMLSGTPYKPSPLTKEKLSVKVHEMLVLAEMSMSALLPKGLRDDFHSIWLNFIKRTELRILEPRDKKALLDQLEPLNTIWNHFNMRMVRGTSILPKAQQSVLRIMHNRWNSMLRIILR